MDLNLPCGPWKKLSAGKWAKHPITLYENAEGMLLLSLFEEDKKGVKGVLVLMKRPFLLRDDKHLPVNAETIVLKKAGNHRFAYALLEAKPVYVRFNQHDLFMAIKSQYHELKMAKLEGAKGIPLVEAEPKIKEALLGDPFSLFSFSPSTKINLKPRVRAPLSSEGGEPVYLDSLSLAVVGGLKEERLNALVTVSENALVSGTPCIVFDSTKKLSVLEKFSPSDKWLSEIGAEKAVYAFKKRIPGKDLFIDLSRIDSIFFAECLGLGEDSAATLKQVGVFPSTLNELLRKIPLTNYAGQKVSRCLTVLQKTAPSIFNRSPPANFAATTGSSKIFYYDLFGLPPEIRLLVIDSVISTFESINRDSVLVVVEEDLSELPISMYSLLSGLPSKGAAIAVNSSSTNTQLSFPHLHLLKYPEVILEEDTQKTRFTIRNSFSRSDKK